MSSIQGKRRGQENDYNSYQLYQLSGGMLCLWGFACEDGQESVVFIA